MEVYAFIENKKTGTIHILKNKQDPYGRILSVKSRLVFNHKSFSIDDLSNELIPNLYNNYLLWNDIYNIRIAAAFFANQGHNVCGNCVRELYKNEGEDID